MRCNEQLSDHYIVLLNLSEKLILALNNSNDVTQISFQCFNYILYTGRYSQEIFYLDVIFLNIN